MQNQKLSEAELFIISPLTTFKLFNFRFLLASHKKRSVKFLQLNDLLHVVQVTLARTRPYKFAKRKR